MSTLLDDLEAHLGAIRARALDRLEATLAPERLTLVTAAGEVMGRDEFLRLHSEWFESDSWSIDTESSRFTREATSRSASYAFGT